MKIISFLAELREASINAVDVKKEVTSSIKEDIERRNSINEMIKEVSMILRGDERWTDLEGLEDLAEVSSHAHVRFKTDHIGKNGEILHQKGEILKPSLNNNYYLNFAINGKHYFNHEAVLASFVGNKPEGYEIDHIDRNTLNCSIENLRYVTHPENMANTDKNTNRKKKNGIIIQYSLEGQPQAVYKSVPQAAFINGWSNAEAQLYRAVNYGIAAKKSYWRRKFEDIEVSVY